MCRARVCAKRRVRCISAVCPGVTVVAVYGGSCMQVEGMQEDEAEWCSTVLVFPYTIKTTRADVRHIAQVMDNFAAGVAL